MKEKKRAQKKAPEAPKRGKSPYIYFSMEKREFVKQQLGEGAPVTAIMRRIAELWKPLTDEEKAPWVRLSVADKLRYDQQMAAYNGPLRVPNKRAKKDPGAPKRAMPAFLYYSQEMRPKIKKGDTNLKNTDISRMLGVQWKALDVDTKDHYMKLEQTDRARYKLEMENFNTGQAEQEEYAQMNRHMRDRIPQQAPVQQMHLAPPVAHYQNHHHPHVMDHFLYHNNYNPSMAAAQMMDPSRMEYPSTVAPIPHLQQQQHLQQYQHHDQQDPLAVDPPSPPSHPHHHIHHAPHPQLVSQSHHTHILHPDLNSQGYYGMHGHQHPPM